MHQYGHYGAALLAYAPLGFFAAALGFGELALLAVTAGSQVAVLLG